MLAAETTVAPTIRLEMEKEADGDAACCLAMTDQDPGADFPTQIQRRRWPPWMAWSLGFRFSESGVLKIMFPQYVQW